MWFWCWVMTIHHLSLNIQDFLLKGIQLKQVQQARAQHIQLTNARLHYYRQGRSHFVFISFVLSWRVWFWILQAVVPMLCGEGTLLSQSYQNFFSLNGNLFLYYYYLFQPCVNRSHSFSVGVCVCVYIYIKIVYWIRLLSEWRN